MPFIEPSKYIGMSSKLYRPTRFFFKINGLPEKLGIGSVRDFQTEIFFATESVFFPSRNIASEPYKIAGPVDEIPYESTYSGDLDVTMRVSASFKERDFMEQWMNLVVSQTTQEMQYPDSYRCNAEIEAYTLNEDFSPYSVRLTDVWPKGIGRVTVGQGLTDAIATMQVQLSFRRYYIVGSPNDPGEDKMNRGADLQERPEFDRPQAQPTAPQIPSPGPPAPQIFIDDPQIFRNDTPQIFRFDADNFTSGPTPPLP